MDLASTQTDRERLLVTDAEYSVETGHKTSQPVVHLFCRDSTGERRRVDVEGFRPYFYIEYEEFVDEPLDVINDRHVIGVEADLEGFRHLSDLDVMDAADGAGEAADALTGVASGDTRVYHESDTNTTIDGDRLVKLYTVEPAHVGKIRDHWNPTYEADVPFERRFLISSGIRRGIEIPAGAERVRYENWQGHSGSQSTITEIQTSDPPDVDPRLCIVDIEVATHGDGIPDPDRARNEITAITAYDSYTGEYAGWLLEHDDWEDAPTEGELSEATRDGIGVDLDQMNVYEHETMLVEEFNQWVNDHDPDLLSGWNSNGFDYPYLVNRSYELSAYTVREWDELGNPGAWRDDQRDEMNVKIDGRVTWDMLTSYKKTQFRDLRSYSLEYVSQTELGMGKEDLDDDLDDAWQYSPVDFMKYNVRDVQAVVEIEQSRELLDLYDNLRAVTGAQYNTCNNNGPMIDTLFLREAYESDFSLITNQPVDPEEGNYPGAKVFDPVPGVHENCVYPDLSSMYPNLFAMLNLGSETIIGDRSDVEVSQYDESDVFAVPTDPRGFKYVPKGEEYDDIDKSEYKGVLSTDGGLREMFEPRYDKLYVLKPDVEESFVRSTIDELIELKYNYTGNMYSAVKRVVNSVYGVMGDSASGGKGFRLFDRRVAEGITLAGRRTIEFTAREFTEYIQAEYDDDAYLVGGDTDSSVSSIPNAPTLAHVRQWSEDAIDHVEDRYDDFVQDEFEMDPEDDHRLEVELESVASALFYMQDDDDIRNQSSEDDAVKKRYAQHIVWDDDDGWIDLPDSDETEYDVLTDPDDRSVLKQQETVGFDTYETGVLSDRDPYSDVSITGFEYVRSDTATVTKEAQEEILTQILLADYPIEAIDPYLNDLIDAIKSGQRPIEDLGRPKGVNKALDEYGWKTVEELEDDSNYTVTSTDRQHGGRYVATPGPTYRGRKYAIDHIPWEDGAAKSVRLYIESVDPHSEFPEVYEYDEFPREDRPDPPEVDREVDAITVEDPDRLPDAFEPDTEKMIDKELRDKLSPILVTIDQSWDGIVGDGRQAGLDAF
jgi:DNA polymerase I